MHGSCKKYSFCDTVFSLSQFGLAHRPNIWAHILSTSVYGHTYLQAVKYLKESVEDIRIRVPKGEKAKVQEHAASMGGKHESICCPCHRGTMERDKQQSE
jgi:hypothetical protein